MANTQDNPLDAAIFAACFTLQWERISAADAYTDHGWDLDTAGWAWWASFTLGTVTYWAVRIETETTLTVTSENGYHWAWHGGEAG